MASITDRHITSDLAERTLQKALDSQHLAKGGLILHSDQGSRYTSKAFTEFCESVHVTQSMSKAGYPYDNAPMERYFNTLKNECTNLYEFRTEDELYRMTKLTERTLKEAGYIHYEVSNFARRGYECRHNTGYWERDNYLGLGLGAASLMENIRYSNTRELYEYIGGTERIRGITWRNEVTEDRGEGEYTYTDEIPATNLHVSAERITRKAQIEEFMFLGLRMIEGISREKFERAFGVAIEAVYYEVLLQLQQEELVVKRAGRVYLSEKGQDLSNYVLSQFLL